MIMGSKCHLPFEAGQEAESKCFIEGFRSAWFRCKIKKISYQKRQIGYHLEYFDYPDEKIEWVSAYQKPPHEESKMELVMRPSFPLICRESQLHVFPESDVIAVINGTWKVGDLVDWWYENCYWSGRIIGVVGEDKVKIQLPQPPIGEGNSYEASCKDLRPSLDWSPESGWTVPLSKEAGNCWHCARLIWLHSEDKESRDKHILAGSTTDKESREEHTQVGSTAGSNDTGFDIKPGNLGLERSNFLSIAEKPRKDRYSLGTTEGKQIVEYRCLASMKCSDTIESSIIELEELANKIRWLKGLLQFGFQWSNEMKPSWRTLKNCGQQR